MILSSESSSKKKIKSKWIRAISGLPSLLHFYRSGTRQAIHESAAHSVLRRPEESGFTGDMKTHTTENLTYSDANCLASHVVSPNMLVNYTPCLLHDERCIMDFKELHIDDEYDLKNGDPLSALLDSSRSPLAQYCEDAQKLAWLKLQLIGENQEFVTPFGKRQLVYADHTASGRSLFFIEDFIARHLLPFYGNTHTDDSYVGGRTSKMMKQAEDYIKLKLGGNKDDVLVMCGWGCTAAIKRLQEVMGITVPSNLRARVLDMMPKEERWLVFTGPYEHHSNLLSWRQSLAEVIEIPANGEGEIDMGKLEEALRGAEASARRQKIGAFSACSNVTGVLTDTRVIARLLHKYGAFACFDFAAGTHCTTRG